MPHTLLFPAIAFAVPLGMLLAGCPGPESPAHYTVRVENLSSQPLGPVVAVIHGATVTVWEAGQLASGGLANLAETGETSSLIDELQSQSHVQAVSSTALPVPAEGRVVPRDAINAPAGPDLVDTQTLEIDGPAGSLFSIVSALLGTNDGFWGLDAVELPQDGALFYFARGYDAGIEENNEREDYINDDASILGPATIPGDEPDSGADPDNRHEATAPPVGIRVHGGIVGDGDIPTDFDFDNLLVRVTITRVANP